MKIIYNNIIPFKGYIAMNICTLLFVRKEYKGKLNETVLNHEAIHSAQMEELLYLPFYIIYLIEWFIRVLFVFPLSHKAYRSIFFEQEAYDNEKNLHYLPTRKHFSMWRRKQK